MLKKLALLITVFSLTIIGCKKNQVTPTEDENINIIKSYIHEKINSAEYNAINWQNFIPTPLKDNVTDYRFLYKDDKNSYLSVRFKNGVTAAQIFKYKIEGSFVSCKLKNLETENTKIENIAIADIISRKNLNNLGIAQPTPGDVTLPWVVVFGYINNSGGLNISIFFWNGGGGGSGNNGNGEVQMFQPDGDGGGVADFQTSVEAQAFLAFLESLNAQEAAILSLYPGLAVPYYLNSETAKGKSIAWAATQCASDSCRNALLNDGKADAIRHAYWNALNKDDMGDNFATILANAHEYGATKPAFVSQAFWDLQRTMDLNNNIVGRNFTYTLLNSDDTIWSKFIEEVNTGGIQAIGLVYICAANGAGNETLKLFSQSCP